MANILNRFVQLVASFLNFLGRRTPEAWDAIYPHLPFVNKQRGAAGNA